MLPELLAPAGSWDCAKAAVENGADAIYFGLDRFNARMRAHNFTLADLPELMAFLHRRGVKGYATLNTLVFPAELAAAAEYLRAIIQAGVDAVIVQDVGICRLIRHLSPDFPIHASTQMTVTSAAGVEFAEALGCQLVVLARECSLVEIEKIRAQTTALPLEVFVHGALCVAYSGQCLTSEALGGRSANRGECAQACRMTYELVVDGQTVDTGDRNYLLSPQDLSGLPVLPELVRAGVSCLKIEGRLKTPEYVANVTWVYRAALDRLAAEVQASKAQAKEDCYRLEMAFSRGLYTGWFEGIDNQQLVHGRFGKKRGVYLGQVSQVLKDGVQLSLSAPVKAGDGVVFDQGRPGEKEQGGRVYQVQSQGRETLLRFGRYDLNLRRIQPGARLWKTSDPALDRAVQQTYSGDQPRQQQPISVQVQGREGEVMVAIATDLQHHSVQATSTIALVAAQNRPLTTDKLRQQLGRLGGTPFTLGQLDNQLAGDLMLPVSELNRLRRQLVQQLEAARSQPRAWQLRPSSLAELLPEPQAPTTEPTLIPLVRSQAQLDAVTALGYRTIYCEFENPATYRAAVQGFRARRPDPTQEIWVAPPRITKPKENYILDQMRRSQADGYLVRNYDHLRYFADQRCRGDFSLNVANPLTAQYFHDHCDLDRLTASYDLNVEQLVDLLGSVPTDWLEVTIHQHMPLFHMEHCVFCAFLSEGKDFRDCGRPCEGQTVTLRDRVGTEHILMADAGCRNTLYNGVAQTAAEYVQTLMTAGARQFRVEFLQESPEQIAQVLGQYQRLLRGELKGSQLWRQLQLQSQLGVTRGPLDGR